MPRIGEIALVNDIEDISDALVLANAAETPATAMARKGKKPENVIYHWTVDKYDAPSNTGVPFNKDADQFVNTQKDRARLSGRVMRQWRNPSVGTAEQEIIKQAGDDGDKFMQSRAKTAIELGQDMEYVALGRQDSAEEQGDDGGSTRGMACWTNAALQTTDTAYVTPVAYRPAAAQIFTGNYSAFWEDDLRDMLQARWDTVRSRGDLVGFLGSAIKARVSDFTKYDASVPVSSSALRRYDGNPEQITSMVEIYKGDFATVKMILDAFTHDVRSGEILDMNKWEIKPLIAPRFRKLEDKGGGPRGINETIYGLANNLPSAHCTIQALNA